MTNQFKIYNLFFADYGIPLSEIKEDTETIIKYTRSWQKYGL